MKKNKANQSTYGVLLVFILLLSIYLLTYSGVPVSDDEHLFAAVSQNLATSGEFRADQLSGNMRLQGRYTNVGPLHPLIGSLAVRAVWGTEGLGAVQVLYFLNPIYTAATAALLYLYARRKGYRGKTGVFAALAFGLTTMAWPYTQTFYREPLAMFLFFSAFVLFESLTAEISSRLAKPVGWLLYALCLMGAVLTKIFILLSLPFFVMLAYKRRKEFLGPNSDKFWSYLFVVVGLLAAGWLVWSGLGLTQYSRMNPTFLSRRYGQLISHFARFLNLETLKSVVGILVSPGKGLLWYSPILIFSFLEVRNKKASHVSLLIPQGTLALFIFVQVFFYHEGWWNISWSTRFLLPVVPLLIAASLPIFDHLLTSKRKFARGLLFGIYIFGVVIQLGGILISDAVYLDFVYTQKAIYDVAKIIWVFDLMPAIQHWRLVLDGLQVNLAAVRNFQFFPVVISLLVVVLVGIILGASRLITKLVDADAKYVRPFGRVGVWMVGFYTLLILPVLLLAAYRSEPIYFPALGYVSSASETLRNQAEPGDLILVDGYQRPAWYHLMNYARLEIPWNSLPEDRSEWSSIDFLSEKPDGSRVWILVEGDSLSTPSAEIEFLAAQNLECVDFSLTPGENTLKYELKFCN